MNIEFVYQILLGTRYFLESRDKIQTPIINKRQEINKQKLKIQNQGNRTSLTFYDIKFKNIDKWDVGQTDRMESINEDDLHNS